jgi:hypothetical protein
VIGTNNVPEPFQGAIDEVRIWNAARSQCDLKTYMNSEIPNTATNLIANYHFNQGFVEYNNSSITSLFDVSGNANNGTLLNFVLSGITSNWIAPGAIISGYSTPNNLSTSSQLSVSACDNYTWFGTPYITSGDKTHLLTNAAGCDSTITLHLTINPLPDKTTSLSGVTITSNQTGATYQWIDCGNANAAITGETNQSYIALTNGSYAVVINNGICTDTSACVNITTTGIDNKVSANQLNVYPNPNNGAFTMHSTMAGNYSITNELGQTIKSIQLNAANNYSINIENLQNGIYFIIGINNNKVTKQKIVVAN